MKCAECGIEFDQIDEDIDVCETCYNENLEARRPRHPDEK